VNVSRGLKFTGLAAVASCLAGASPPPNRNVVLGNASILELADAFKGICVRGYPSRDSTLSLLEGWKPVKDPQLNSLAKHTVMEIFKRRDISVILSRSNADEPKLSSCHVSEFEQHHLSNTEILSSFISSLALGTPADNEEDLVGWRYPDQKQVIYGQVIRSGRDKYLMMRIQQYSEKAN